MPAKTPAPVGESFSYWTVIADIPRSGKWLCRCRCGKEKPVQRSHLKAGVTKSCGCREPTMPVKHGLSAAAGLEGKVYRAWKNIKQRTENPHNSKYARYGGRGIKLAEEFKDDFSAFLREVGLPPTPLHSVDRKNNDLGYVAGNMRWSTPGEQALNTSKNHTLTYNGCARTLTEWSELVGIPYSVLSARVNRLGWSAEKALTTPTRPFGISTNSTLFKAYTK